MKRLSACRLCCHRSAGRSIAGDVKAHWTRWRLTGIRFLTQDVIDLITPKEVSGKRQGGDLVEGKKTLIMIHAFENGVIVPVFGKKEASEEEIQQSISILQKSRSIEYARSRAEEMVVKGKKALDVLPDSDAKATMLELADYMIRRRY